MDEEASFDRAFLELAYGDLVMPLCVLDRFGITVFANGADARLLGRRKAELEGAPASLYFVNRQDFDFLRHKWETQETITDYTTSIRHQDGTVFRVRLSSCPLPQNSAYTCVFKRNVEEFQRKSDNLEILNHAIKELSVVRDTETALNGILKIIVPSLADWMTIDLYRKGELIMLKVEHGDNPKLAPAVDYKRSTSSASDPSSLLFHTLTEGKVWYFPVVTEELLQQHIADAERRTFLTQFNITSAIIVPMYFNEQIYGAITFIRTQEGRYYNEDDLELFKNLANHIALVLENARLNEDAQHEIEQRELAERYFRVIADSVPQKILTTNTDGKGIYYNRQWADFLGVDAMELYEAGLWPYIHPEDVEDSRKAWHRALATRSDFQMQHRFRDRDGNYRWQLTRARPVQDDKGRLLNWIASVTDIDEQKRVEEKKDEFITIASHELKTPLTSLKAYLQLLEKVAGYSEKHHAFLEKAMSQVRRLELLVSDLLDVSKISSGKIAFNTSEFSMEELIEEVVLNLRLLHPDFEIVLEQNDKFRFCGDRARIEQVLINLLNNAIKYSGVSRRVVVSARAKWSWFIISVQDFGIGISRDHFNDLFQRFYRVNNTYQGVGLGLFIANEIAHAHGGNIDVESELNKGTTFYFKLPLNR